MDYQPLIDATSFLIMAVTIGGIAGIVLALLGVVPVMVTKQIIIFTQDDKEEVLNKMQINVGDISDLVDEEDIHY
tara:strand:- start:1204 stop:1428 length:225 start_codon:yes stop_codon:yes gene_type:complete